MIFISYRRNDSAEFVGQFASALRRKLQGAEVFTDIQSLKLGVDFKESIISAIWQSTIMIVVIGPAWNPFDPITKVPKLFSDDDVVRLEIEEGIKRNLLMIPIVLPRAEMPQPPQLPKSIQGLCTKGACILSLTDIDRQIDSVVAELDTRRLGISSELESIADGLTMDRSLDKALAFYCQAITLSNMSGRLYSKRAFVHEELQDISSALADYNRSIELDPCDALAWAGRSHHYNRTGQLELALADINQAVNITISNPAVYSMRANLNWVMRRYLDCIRDLSSCIKLDPNNVDYRLRRIEAYIDLRHPELADDDIEFVRKIDPSNSKLRVLQLRI
jgi:hypothetical protein